MSTETTISTLWQKSKLLIKAGIIGILILLLLIPTEYIKDLIREREQRQKEAAHEVNSKWAGRQNIAGPILVLPFLQHDKDSVTNQSKQKQYAYFLPEELSINSTVVPQKKYRGIYKVMLYSSINKINGVFGNIHPELLNISEQDILWEEAFIRIYINDMKGVNEQLKPKWKDKEINLLPEIKSDKTIMESVSCALHLSGMDDLKNATFSTEINLEGSEQLVFTPVGSTTLVTMSSTWPDPSFTGDALPQSTEIKEGGFTASWKSVSHKRNFPQQWRENNFNVYNYNTVFTDAAGNIGASAFGADLFISVNGYQKTMRSVKYAVLCILLTFAAFFIIESINKQSVHPFQYALIGLALVMFYTLLLSFSEYIGFDMAYVISSIATIGLIAWFVRGILKSSKSSALLATILVLLYSYVFTILQLQDYALLMGSLGLFISLAVIMYFSRKIQW